MENERMSNLIDYDKMLKIMEDDIIKDIITRKEKYSEYDLLFLDYYKKRFDYKLKNASIYREPIGHQDIIYVATLVDESTNSEVYIKMNDKKVADKVIFVVIEETI